MSCIFHPCNMVPHFHVSQFPHLQVGAANSCLAFSTPATWCRIFMSRKFMSRIFSVPIKTKVLLCPQNYQHFDISRCLSTVNSSPESFFLSLLCFYIVYSCTVRPNTVLCHITVLWTPVSVSARILAFVIQLNERNKLKLKLRHYSKHLLHANS